MGEKGFTLIELMIVVAILAILAAAAFPVMGEQLKKAKDANCLKVMTVLRSAVNLEYASKEGREYVEKITDLDVRFTSTLAKKVKVGDGDADFVSDRISSYQVVAGRVKKGNSTSVGYADLAGEYNVLEIYYNNENGVMYGDGTQNGIDYKDTKGKFWKNY